MSRACSECNKHGTCAKERKVSSGKGWCSKFYQSRRSLETDRDRLAAELATAHEEIALSRQSEGETMADLLAVREELGRGWISTDDHLPEDGQNVAFITKCARDPFYHGRVLGGRYSAGEFGGFSVPGLMSEASHWLALPPTPAALSQPTQPTKDETGEESR